MGSDDHKKARIRSPSYPAVDLKEAIGRAKQFKEFGGQHPITIKFVLEHWGYKSSSSNGMKMVAALSSFGLVDAIGSGDDRKIRLSQRAMRILVDHEDSPEWKNAIKDSALSPKIYKELWEKWGPNMPPDKEVYAYLVLERGFNESAVRGFLDDYKSTLEFAKLDNSAKIGTLEETAEGGELFVEPESESYEKQKDRRIFPAGKPLVERITGPDGAILLQFSDTPSYDQYKFLEAYIRLRMMILDPSKAAKDLQN